MSRVIDTGPGSERRRLLREALESLIVDYAGGAEQLPGDPEAWLRLVDATVAVAEECRRIQADAVHRARQADHPWAAIGQRLAVTRQAAQQRFTVEPQVLGYGKRDGTERVVRDANAFNEVKILEDEGAAGYQLIGLGPFKLTFKASRQRWEHRREVGLGLAARRARLEASGWTWVGSWFPFHYFKRPIESTRV